MDIEEFGIEEKVKGILCDLSGEEVVDNTATLREDLALDSISMITLLVDIEEVFEIELDQSDMNPYDLITVQNVINLVCRYRGD